MHSVNYFFRQDGEHKYAYDEETLIALVRDCGFSNVDQRPWNSALGLESRRVERYMSMALSLQSSDGDRTFQADFLFYAG